MIINVHAHIRADHDPHQRVNYYRAPGMDKVCLSGDNANALAAWKADPEFVIPVAEGALGKLTADDVKAFHDKGFKALRFENPVAPYDDERFFPVYEKAQELGLPVFLHTGHNRDATPCRTEFMNPIVLDSIARFFPELYIVGSQLGSPWFFQAVTAMMYNKRVFFDLSGGVARGIPLALYKLIFTLRDVYLLPGGIRHRLYDEGINQDIFRKLVFGSGNPQPEVVVAFYRDLFAGLRVDFQIQGLILWANAAEMLGIREGAESVS